MDLYRFLYLYRPVSDPVPKHTCICTCSSNYTISVPAPLVPVLLPAPVPFPLSAPVLVPLPAPLPVPLPAPVPVPLPATVLEFLYQHLICTYVHCARLCTIIFTCIRAPAPVPAPAPAHAPAPAPASAYLHLHSRVCTGTFTCTLYLMQGQQS
jgi:hypothetical protein